jgi:hypothetical protein
MWEPRDQPLPGSFPKKDPGYEVDARLVWFQSIEQPQALSVVGEHN